MEIKSEPFKQINRTYLIQSHELKNKLELKGEIMNMGLDRGRSPDDIDKGVSPDYDVWVIETVEIIKAINEKQTRM